MPTRFGDLLANSPQDGDDKNYIAYDDSSKKFVIRNIDADKVFSESAEDNNVPEVFVDQIEDKVNLSNISLFSIDGGDF
jgi:phosphosulfolactate synthase (CoM biosynthesis protein A)|tara:strand:- start:2701 stop:2937 length:237 start_codon:yes stop_codon:yes gene_type:complete